MAVVCTCDCGARFEVADSPGDVPPCCPECGQPVTVAHQSGPEARLDWLALASVLLAITGACTVVGSLLGSLVGLAALLRIRTSKHPRRGASLALAGVGMGLGFAALSWMLLRSEASEGVAAWLRRVRLIGQVETTIPAQITSRDGLCQLPRPRGDWLQLRPGFSPDSSIDELVARRDVVLMLPRYRAMLDLSRETENIQPTLADQRLTILDELAAPRRPLLGDDDQENPLRTPPSVPVEETSRELPEVDGYRAYEWSFALRRGGQHWQFLIRAYRPRGVRGSTAFYLLRLYAPVHHYRKVEEEFRAIANSVRFPG
ncbi:MAG: hypothetical protein U0840_21060 [Gemmataceae bacterium]